MSGELKNWLVWGKTHTLVSEVLLNENSTKGINEIKVTMC